MFNSKYLKYKQKYIDLKNKTGGAKQEKILYAKTGSSNPRIYYYIGKHSGNFVKFIYVTMNTDGTFTPTGKSKIISKSESYGVYIGPNIIKFKV